MKRSLLSTVLATICAYSLQAQVTRINNNNSLEVIIPFNTTKVILTSEIDSSIWTTDATLAGTVPVPTSVKYEAFGQLLSGKFIFRGSTPATGSELYMYDGTNVAIISDINPGAASSAPGPMTLLNGFLYFVATSPAEGRELWRTDGTPAGTTLVKDITTGPASSFDTTFFDVSILYSSGSYLLFAANRPGSGNELWRSDGSGPGTVLLKEINPGNANADSSNPRLFSPFNGKALFAATDSTHGEEIWVSDGSPGGTVMLKDINPGTGSSTSVIFLIIPGFPPFAFPVFFGFHVFNNAAYFQAFDGTNTGVVWKTDGTPGGTTLLKTIITGTAPSFAFTIDGVNLPNKFIFPVADTMSRSELWESNGTPGGTVLFKAFSPYASGDIPAVYIPFNADFLNPSFTQPLFHGNQFFFNARGTTEGNELWISDGTLAGTHVVKDIDPAGDGVGTDQNSSYMYTTNALFFAANNGTQGNELWKTDGTDPGTSNVKDINPNAPDAEPGLSLIFNRHIIFTATDGDDPDHRDLFVVDGVFDALPIKLTDFTVTRKTNDASLQWSTAQELYTKNFTVQRSDDAQHFENIGIVQATGTSSSRHDYSFTDAGIVTSGKSIVYYRLIAADKDGKSANSNVISLKLKGSNEWNVRLLSNPIQDNVNVLLSDISGNLQLTIKDINGRTMYTNSFRNINGQVTLGASLQRGTYVLIAENNNERKVIKFIK